MKEYKLGIKESLEEIVIIQTENEEQALAQLKKMHEEGDIVLESSSYLETEFMDFGCVNEIDKEMYKTYKEGIAL